MTDVRIAGPLHLRPDLKHLRAARAYSNVRARSGRRARESRFGNPTKPRILERPLVGNSLLIRMDAKESASLPSPQRDLSNETAPEIAGTTETPEEGSKVPLSSDIPGARLSSFAHQWTGPRLPLSRYCPGDTIGHGLPTPHLLPATPGELQLLQSFARGRNAHSQWSNLSSPLSTCLHFPHFPSPKDIRLLQAHFRSQLSQSAHTDSPFPHDESYRVGHQPGWLL